MPKSLLFVGCLNREAPYFQGARGKGIAVLSFDEETGAAELLSETDDLDNPTFLSLDASRGTLYANSEIFGHKEGTISAYRFDRQSGALTYLNKQASLGSITAYNAVAPDGRHLLVANYGMGDGGPDRSVVVFPIADDGSLGAPVSSVRHEGTGPDASRQERAHAHCVYPLGDGDWLVADLGIDQLVSYRLDPDGKLTKAGETALAPGAGPRHIAVAGNGAAVFVINELASTVESFRRSADGTLTRVSSLPAVPVGTQGNHCADLHLSPDGRFLYASNRGHDSIAVFAVDQRTAEFTPAGHFPSGGATPRNFAITPSGRRVLVANQNSDSIVVFPRDAATGALGEAIATIKVGTPMCVRVLDL